MSTNEASCLSKQKQAGCTGIQQGACMTLFYKTKIDGQYENHFSKSCWDSYSDCEGYCSSPVVVDDATECEVIQV